MPQRSRLATRARKGWANRFGGRQRSGHSRENLMPMAGRQPATSSGGHAQHEPMPAEAFIGANSLSELSDHVFVDIDGHEPEAWDHQLEPRYETTGTAVDREALPEPSISGTTVDPIPNREEGPADAQPAGTSDKIVAQRLGVALVVLLVCFWTYRSEANAPTTGAGAGTGAHVPSDPGESTVQSASSNGITWLDGTETGTPSSVTPSEYEHSEIFPVALLEKFCDPFDAKALESGFANPHSLIILSFLAPVLFELIKLLRRLAKLYTTTVTSIGSFASKSAGSVINGSERLILGNVAGSLPAVARDDVTNAVKTKANDLKEKADEAIEGTVGRQLDATTEKLDELEKAFGSDIDTGSASKSATVDDYNLRITREETEREVEMAQTVSFTLIHLGLAVAVAVDYFEHIDSAVTGDSIMCHASKVLVMPLFKAFAVSMWNVLMSVTNYVHWELSRTDTPKAVVKDALKIPAPLRPVHRNIIIRAVTLFTAGALAVWTAAALIVAPALVGFFPIAVALLVAVPMIVLVLPLYLISRAWGCVPDDVAELKKRKLLVLSKYFDKIDKDNSKAISREELHAFYGTTVPRAVIERIFDKLDSNNDNDVSKPEFMTAAGLGKEWEAHAAAETNGGVDSDSILSYKSVLTLLTGEPRLLLKVGLMQAFTTMMLMAWFGGVYYGQESWSSAASAMYAQLPPLTMHLALSWPQLVFSLSFQLPTLHWPSTILCFVSFGLLGIEYFQKLVAWIDRRLGDVPGVNDAAIAFALGLIGSLGTLPMVPFRELTTRLCGSGGAESKSRAASAARRTPAAETQAHETENKPTSNAAEGYGSPDTMKVYPEVTDRDVEVYARNNPEAEELDFAGCTSLSNQALWSVATSCGSAECRKVQTLKLNGCKLIDDDGLRPIAKSIGSSLQLVDLRGVQKVTSKGVAALAMQGQSLDVTTECDDSTARSQLIVSSKLNAEVEKLMGSGDKATYGRLNLSLAAFPEASSITLPSSDDDGAVSGMILLALNKLPTLVEGGLQLGEQAQASEGLRLELTEEVNRNTHIEIKIGEWMMAKHLRLVFAMSSADRIVSLNLRGVNLRKDGGAKALAVAAAAGRLQGLAELNVSGCKLGTKAAADIADVISNK